MRSRLSATLAVALGAGLVAASGAAAAADATIATVSAKRATTATCHVRPLAPGASVRRTPYTASRTGLLHAALRSAGGDWDLAVFDARSGRLVAAGAAPGRSEIAEGFVAAGERLVVQACRRAGASTQARLLLRTVALAPQTATAAARVVRVATPDQASRRRLAALGLDPAERADASSVDVVLHDEADAAALARAGLSWTVRIADLRERAAANLATDLRNAARAARSSRAVGGRSIRAVPSGRNTYRHLADIENELKLLAQQHPGLVKLITLPQRSLLGRPVLGIEIARDVNVPGGQPVFLQLGTHHAREWPAAEHPMEWAHDLINGYGRDAQITRLVDTTRNIIVPVVNPDGFNLSREWPVDLGTILAGIDLPAQINGLLPIDDPAYTAALLGDQGIAPAPGTGFAYKRRNCRVADGQVPVPGECESLANRRRGVDPNRNYGGFWGGLGSGFDVEDDTYRGAAPFSEPEVQNVRELVSAHQVTTLITNHTFGNLILRPPSVAGPQPVPDAALLKALGDAMAAKNGYASQFGFELYDTSGATEDWSYSVTGGLGFTFEIGADEFHPPYAEVAAEYARNRGAYLVALQSTADSARHAVLEGRASEGTVLRAHKEVESTTSPVVIDFAANTTPARSFRDVLDTTMTVGSSGRFAWHLNPSTRPGAPAPESWTVTCERPAGTVLATGSVVIGRGERTALELCALGFSVAVDRRRVAIALDRGLRTRARCTLRCTASVELSIDNASARRLGLTRGTKRVVVARGSAGRSFTGRKLFSARFTQVARRRLRAARRLSLRVTATGLSGTTDRRNVRRTLTLMR
ncbi:MAG TPA: M14 family zinc carboxypeptidase [Solirubrobacteraceae bacterium]|nr:M14 family zinc carboxypeptidase [Solirubrobacteraceae bacterium]